MILDAGVENVDFVCECGKCHFEVSIGEEAVICSCGNLLTFQKEKDHFAYFWMGKGKCSQLLGLAINQDTRNLC